MTSYAVLGDAELVGGVEWLNVTCRRCHWSADAYDDEAVQTVAGLVARILTHECHPVVDSVNDTPVVRLDGLTN